MRRRRRRMDINGIKCRVVGVAAATGNGSFHAAPSGALFPFATNRRLISLARCRKIMQDTNMRSQPCLFVDRDALDIGLAPFFVFVLPHHRRRRRGENTGVIMINDKA